jgi:ABC-type antimicrobial peptide transport system permease subunit
MTLAVQTFNEPETLAGPLQALVHSVDADLPIFRVSTMDDIFRKRALNTLHLADSILASAGFMGFALALVGLYAVVAYQVGRRTREIGIRMALGAARLQVMQMILRQAAFMGGGGICIGLAFSFAVVRAVESGLNVKSDPTLFWLLPAALFLTTLLAAAVPARRASRVDPQQALRQD